MAVAELANLADATAGHLDSVVLVEPVSAVSLCC